MSCSHLVELEFQRHVLAAFGAVVIRESAAFHGHVLAHVDAPGVVRVAGEQTIRADLDAVGPNVVVVVAIIPAVCIAAHCDLSWQGWMMWR
jgi:hypothetical protein